MKNEKIKEEFRCELEVFLDEHFPKLNVDDTSKPSPNRRSAALCLFAEACLLFNKKIDEIIR